MSIRVLQSHKWSLESLRFKYERNRSSLRCEPPIQTIKLGSATLTLGGRFFKNVGDQVDELPTIHQNVNIGSETLPLPLRTVLGQTFDAGHVFEVRFLFLKLKRHKRTQLHKNTSQIGPVARLRPKLSDYCLEWLRMTLCSMIFRLAGQLIRLFGSNFLFASS